MLSILVPAPMIDINGKQFDSLELQECIHDTLKWLNRHHNTKLCRKRRALLFLQACEDAGFTKLSRSVKQMISHLQKGAQHD